MHIDFKITTWERIELPESEKEQILDKVKKGEFTSALDISNDIFGEHDVECNHMIEVDEQMTVEENGGQSTIEAFEGNDLIWNNQPK